ncbi:MAG: pyrroline-5-carboxylate reductase, partial [Verrucomicrobia bacterium]|nr:pyrroline-5-carboxylate reductase [Verrucomicrobiota bacterium]
MKLGLIGCGKMGGALLRGVIKAGLVKPTDITACDKFPEASTALAKEFKGLKNVKAPSDVAAASDIIILAVKPHDMQKLLETLASSRARLFLSIAAGLTLKQLEGWLGGNHRVIRSMPNTPALVLQGASAFVRGSKATDKDAAAAKSILGAVGTVSEVTENLLDAVTGLSGSGPAYVYTVIEAMADGGVLMGLPRVAALQ